jgi:meso-butanediol dehydrogenase/(S,S)-butanediol dehydrogenase/diacetyl reductase
MKEKNVNGRFAGKVVIVTGAAGGIGAAITERFLSEGASVLAADVAADELEKFVACHALGSDRIEGQLTDVSDAESVQAMVDAAIAKFGRLDTLVNNAGFALFGTVETITIEQWHRVIDVDLNSVFYGVRAALPHLRRTGGSVVNTASISGMGGAKGLAPYYAAKGGVVNLTRYLAVEHGGEGVRINAVCPGPTNNGKAAMNLEALDDAYRAVIPAGRQGKPEEIAAAVAFLASDDASFVNGHNLVVDGGLTAWTGEPDVPSIVTAVQR